MMVNKRRATPSSESARSEWSATSSDAVKRKRRISYTHADGDVKTAGFAGLGVDKADARRRCNGMMETCDLESGILSMTVHEVHEDNGDGPAEIAEIPPQRSALLNAI